MSECGDCKKWMKKPDCPREKGTMAGGPSSGDYACDEFEPRKAKPEAPDAGETYDWADVPKDAGASFVKEFKEIVERQANEHTFWVCFEDCIQMIEAYEKLEREVEMLKRTCKGRYDHERALEKELVVAKVEIEKHKGAMPLELVDRSRDLLKREYEKQLTQARKEVAEAKAERDGFERCWKSADTLLELTEADLETERTKSAALVEALEKCETAAGRGAIPAVRMWASETLEKWSK